MKSYIHYIILLTFLQGIAFNLAHPITPSFVNQLEIPAVFFGVFFSAMSLGSVFGSPFWGFLFDKGYMVRTFTIGALLYAMGQLSFAFSNDVLFMVISRFVSGIGAVASTIVLSALVISHSDKTSLGKHLSMFAATGIIGSSLGYYLGGALSNLRPFLGVETYHFMFIFQSSFTLLFMILSYFILKKFKLVKQETKTFISELRSLNQMPLYQWLFFIALLIVTMSSMFLSKYIDVSLTNRNYDPDSIGFYVLITGIVSVITSIVIVPKLYKFKSYPVLLLLLLISSITVFITFSIENLMIALYTIYIIYVMAKASFQPIEQSYIATFGESIGKLMGLRQFFISIGMVLGPLLLGILHDFNETLSFYTASMLFLIGLFFIIIAQNLFIKKS